MKIEISSNELHLLDELVRLSNGSYSRELVLSSAIYSFYYSTKSALDIWSLQNNALKPINV